MLRVFNVEFQPEQQMTCCQRYSKTPYLPVKCSGAEVWGRIKWQCTTVMNIRAIVSHADYSANFRWPLRSSSRALNGARFRVRYHHAVRCSAFRADLGSVSRNRAAWARWEAWWTSGRLIDCSRREISPSLQHLTVFTLKLCEHCNQNLLWHQLYNSIYSCLCFLSTFLPLTLPSALCHVEWAAAPDYCAVTLRGTLCAEEFPSAQKKELHIH